MFSIAKICQNMIATNVFCAIQKSISTFYILLGGEGRYINKQSLSSVKPKRVKAESPNL